MSKPNEGNDMSSAIAGAVERIEAVPHNAESMKLINRILDQNDRIIAINSDLMKVASSYTMMIVGIRSKAEIMEQYQ